MVFPVSSYNGKLYYQVSQFSSNGVLFYDADELYSVLKNTSDFFWVVRELNIPSF